jgi:hypothetical protein
MHPPDTLPAVRSSAAYMLEVPGRLPSCLAHRGVRGSIGRIGAVRPGAWIWDAHQRTAPRSARAGSDTAPTTSQTVAANCGSLESSQGAPGVRLQTERREIVDTADCVSRTSLAIERVDQCVASVSALSRLLTFTSSVCSSVTSAGAQASAHRSDHPVDARQTARATSAPSDDAPQAARRSPCRSALGRQRHATRRQRARMPGRITEHP